MYDDQLQWQEEIVKCRNSSRLTQRKSLKGNLPFVNVNFKFINMHLLFCTPHLGVSNNEIRGSYPVFLDVVFLFIPLSIHPSHYTQYLMKHQSWYIDSIWRNVASHHSIPRFIFEKYHSVLWITVQIRDWLSMSRNYLSLEDNIFCCKVWTACFLPNSHN